MLSFNCGLNVFCRSWTIWNDKKKSRNRELSAQQRTQQSGLNYWSRWSRWSRWSHHWSQYKWTRYCKLRSMLKVVRCRISKTWGNANLSLQSLFLCFVTTQYLRRSVRFKFCLQLSYWQCSWIEVTVSPFLCAFSIIRKMQKCKPRTKKLTPLMRISLRQLLWAGWLKVFSRVLFERTKSCLLSSESW